MGYSTVLQCGLLYLGKITVRVLCFVFVYNVLTRKVGRRELVQILNQLPARAPLCFCTVLFFYSFIIHSKQKRGRKYLNSVYCTNNLPEFQAGKR